MKTIIQLTGVGIFISASIFFSLSPAFATNSREALKACLDNPNCTASVTIDGVVITVNPGTGGTVIICPIKNGPCGVLPSRLQPHNFNHAGEGGNAKPANGGNAGGGAVGASGGGG